MRTIEKDAEILLNYKEEKEEFDYGRSCSRPEYSCVRVWTVHWRGRIWWRITG